MSAPSEADTGGGGGGGGFWRVGGRQRADGVQKASLRPDSRVNGEAAKENR